MLTSTPGEPYSASTQAGAPPYLDLTGVVPTIDLRDRAVRGVEPRTPPPGALNEASSAQPKLLRDHRVAVIVSVIACTASLYLLQDLIWPHHTTPHGLFGKAWAWGSVIWLVAFIPSTLALAGLLCAGVRNDDEPAPRVPRVVSFRIVSRGINHDALERTVQRIRVEMWRTPLFPYVIEVVTDVPVNLDPAHDLVAFVVPDQYVTPNATRFKARALQYVLEWSMLPDYAWIVHLDEETQPTPSGIRGIARMIDEEERSGQLRIGQGAILYHRQWAKHPLLTLADVQRTGDDFARFRLQHRIGRMLFGLHGSFIVVRNDVEKSVGFDFGPAGSVTEDAYWALLCTARGYRSRWVDGFLEEQSCQTYEDFVLQRRRWFLGLWLTVLNAPVPRRWSITLLVFVLLWALAPLSAAYTILHLFFVSFQVQPWLRMLANFSFGTYVTIGLIGLRVNLAEYGRFGWPRRALSYIVWIALFPFFSLLECAGVAYGIVDRDFGFHVVGK